MPDSEPDKPTPANPPEGGKASSYADTEHPGSEFETAELPALPDPSDEAAPGESIHGFVIDASKPGSRTDTVVVPREGQRPPMVLPDTGPVESGKAGEEPDDDTGDEDVSQSVHRVMTDPLRPGSNLDTKVISNPNGYESVERVIAAPQRPGSMEQTRTMHADEIAAAIARDGKPGDDDDIDETKTRRSTGSVGDMETREVPALNDEWRTRAADAARSLGEPDGYVDAAMQDSMEAEAAKAGAETDDWDDIQDEALAHSVRVASGEIPLPPDMQPRSVAGSVLTRARDAWANWAGLRLEQRMPYFHKLREELVVQRGDYVPAMATAIARPMVETLVGEYLPLLESLRTLEDTVAPLLVEQYGAEPSIIAEGAVSAVRQVPHGVVVIALSASSPFGLPMTLAIDALATGNAVLLCGAATNPRVNETMRKMFSRAGFPENIVQVISGEDGNLRALAESGPNLFLYEGDRDTAARLASFCVHSGAEFRQLRRAKDLLLILKGANMERAVQAALWGSFASAGMVNASIERVVVESAMFDEFRMRFIESAREMNSHHAQLASVGDAFNERRYRALMEDALARGARITYPAGEVPGRWIHWKAAIIEGLPQAAALSVEKLEGPGCTLYRAEDPVTELANLLRIAPANHISVLGSPDRKRRAALEAMPCARIGFNEPLLVGAVAGGAPIGPDLPRTQAGPSAMLRPKVITDGPSAGDRVGWFPYTDDKAYALMDAIEAVYSSEFKRRLSGNLRISFDSERRRLLRGF